MERADSVTLTNKMSVGNHIADIIIIIIFLKNSQKVEA